MHLLEKLLKTFSFDGWSSLASSLMPSIKYSGTGLTMALSTITLVVQILFGIDALAFAALFIVMLCELCSGVMASHYNKEPFSSERFSRFTLKLACYLILIFVSNSMANSFKATDQDLASVTFRWLHIFLTVQIVFENVVSVLENIAVLSGKDKTHWIIKIQDKINNFFN